MYDILIVGCGPAGASLGFLMAKEGFKVLIVERKREIEEPTICGEFLPEFSVIKRAFSERFNSALDFLRDNFYRDEFILNDTSQITLDFCGRRRELNLKGKVISRKKVVSMLVEMVEGFGAEIMLSTSYIRSIEGQSKDKVISLLRGKGNRFEKSSLLVGADGFPSRVSRSMRLKNRIEGKDIAYVTVQLAKGRHQSDSIYMGFYKNFAPGGYAWVIPRGNGLLKVGVGLRKNYGLNVMRCHEVFLKKLGFEGLGQVLGKALPVGGLFKRISGPNCLLVGDAAGLVMPVNGGGIPTAVISSFIAANVLKNWFEDPFSSSELFKNLMMECFGRTFKVALRARTVFDFFTELGMLGLIALLPIQAIGGIISLDRSSLGFKLLDLL